MAHLIRVCVAGATGRVGRGLAAAINQTSDLRVVAAIARRNIGQDLGVVIGEPSLRGVQISELESALATSPDVLVDFTRADAVKHHVLSAIGRGVHVVIGSSGLTDPDYTAIDDAAHQRGVGVVAAGNLALTAVLLGQFAAAAARAIPHWEITDFASAEKIDAPSGTARELAFRLAQVRRPELPRAIADIVGAPESRGATVNGAQLHSVRLPGYLSAVEITFGQSGERLTLRHEALDATAPYVGGAILAIRAVPRLRGLTRGLDSLLAADNSR